MITISCRCGHVDDFDNFTRTPLYGDFKPGEFQCPACGCAWQRKEGGYQVLRAGAESMIIATKVDIIMIDGRF